MTPGHTSGTVSNFLKIFVMYNMYGRKSAGCAGFLLLLKQPTMDTAECARGAKQAPLLDELQPKGRAPTPPVPLGLDFPPRQGMVLPSRGLLLAAVAVVKTRFDLVVG